MRSPNPHAAFNRELGAELDAQAHIEELVSMVRAAVEPGKENTDPVNITELIEKIVVSPPPDPG